MTFFFNNTINFNFFKFIRAVQNTAAQLITIATVILIFAISSVHAQSVAQISVTLRNERQEPVAGASAKLLNTNFSATADVKGQLTFKNVPAGEYSIEVNALGYATIVRRITVPNGSLEITLGTEARQLDEVVVTAQSVEEQPQSLPLSLSVISAKKIQNYRLWNSKEITALVPNLYAASPGDNRNVTSIRGITTTSYDPAVATYIDGVNQFGLDTYIAQLEDIERIEVLRGPQGTLYGRNALGGVINIITKQPGNETRGFAELSFGNFNQQRYNLGFRTPLIKNKLFFGISGLFTKQNGFYTNTFNNTRFDDQHSFLANYYLKFLANERLSFSLNVKHVNNRNNGTFPLNPDPVMAITDPFTVNQNNTTKLIDNILNASLSVKYTGKSFNFTSQSAYQSNYRYYNSPIDGDFSPIDGVSIINNYGGDYNKVKVGTQEFTFTSPASSTSRISWVGGLYGFYNNSPVKQGIHFGKDAALVGAPFPFFTNITINNQKRFGTAVFGQATYKLTTRLNITAGLRYDYEHDKQSIAGAFQQDGQAAITTRTDTSSTAAFRAFSPKLSLGYTISDRSNLFAGYSKGFRTGGISQLGSDPNQPPLDVYRPETSNNFEIGSKNTFLDGRMLMNLTVFYTRINNAQVPTLILPDAITVTRNAGKLESKGAELELSVKPLKGFTAEYNLGYTHARYRLLYVASNGASVNLTGNHQIFTPDVTSVLGLQYNYAVNPDGKINLIIHGDWRYLGDTYFDLANNVKQGAYHLFNGRVGVAVNKISVFFWENNLLNKHYIDYAYDFGAAHLGNPRTFGLSIINNF